jgi:ABC-type antimicrobial peptide transport system permease subunit
MAIGAGARDVLRMVLRQGAWQIVAGMVLGFGVAVALANAMSTVFFQVSPYDGATFVGVGALLLVTGLAAAFVPARRAARVDPLAALRVQ